VLEHADPVAEIADVDAIFDVDVHTDGVVWLPLQGRRRHKDESRVPMPEQAVTQNVRECVVVVIDRHGYTGR